MKAQSVPIPEGASVGGHHFPGTEPNITYHEHNRVFSRFLLKDSRVL